ncbi:MAG TPA: prolipoprotein diacylglyceryl transferase family protein [Flavipsychrobacter sp.]|nr:prolipoprotein diacylglyceryl transferase family protein [Flavipsychrobacter sp.]
MYPDFQFLLQDLFGIDAPGWLSIFKVFGLFVALAFLTAAYVLVLDLKRKEATGLMQPEFETVKIGEPLKTSELLWSAVIGFLLGYKIGGFWSYWQEISPNPMGYIFSLQGNLLVGVLLAAIMGYAKYVEKKKQQLDEPVEKRVAIYPHMRITEFIVAAMIAGLAGAKIFNAFETWEQFIKNPVESLLSSSGLTFYGGLITAAVVVAWYAKRHHIPVKHLADSFAPALMLAYGVGRLGCHFAGDGDWGIFNSAYVTDSIGMLQPAAQGAYLKALQADPGYLAELTHQFGALDKIPHLYEPAGLLPRWMVAMNYAHNVNNEGVRLITDTSSYNHVLPVSVFPTAMWEAGVCIGLFFILWTLRKRVKHAWHLTGIYLILNGLERFFVEKIRVNTTYDFGFIHPTQAEIISFVFILLGLGILLFYRDKKGTLTINPA